RLRCRGRRAARPQGDRLLPARQAAARHRPGDPADAARGGRDRRHAARTGARRGRHAADPAAGRGRAAAPAAGARPVAARARAGRTDRRAPRSHAGPLMILNERTPVWHYLRRAFAVFDPALMIGLALLFVLSLVTMHSAAIDYPGRFDAHLR